MLCRACGKRSNIPDEYICRDCMNLYDAMKPWRPVDVHGREDPEWMTPSGWGTMFERQRRVDRGEWTQKEYDEFMARQIGTRNPKGENNHKGDKVTIDKMEDGQAWLRGLPPFKYKCKQRYVIINPQK